MKLIRFIIITVICLWTMCISCSKNEVPVKASCGTPSSELYPGIPIIKDPRDGQVYPTVQIGSQCWFQRNLNYESANSWCYDNDTANCTIYGRLYDWETALVVCPSGWHLPSDEEWKILEGTVDTQYGVGNPQWNEIGYRGLDAGKHLKSAMGWYNNGNGDDSSGFTALPAGNRDPGGSFFNLSKIAYFWTPKSVANWGVVKRNLSYMFDDVNRNYQYPENGYPVRCIKDD